MDLAEAHVTVKPDLTKFEDDLRMQLAEALESIAADLRRQQPR